MGVPKWYAFGLNAFAIAIETKKINHHKQTPS